MIPAVKVRSMVDVDHEHDPVCHSMKITQRQNDDARSQLNKSCLAAWQTAVGLIESENGSLENESVPYLPTTPFASPLIRNTWNGALTSSLLLLRGAERCNWLGCNFSHYHERKGVIFS
jgi:hypothetical protein